MKNTEIEWCFKSTDGLFDTLKTQIENAGFYIDNPNVNHLVSTYYDTPNLNIRKKARVVLRVRVQDGLTFVQTIKGKKEKSDDAAIATRFEHEVDLPSEQPDISAFTDADIAKKFDGIQNADLIPLFITDYTRTDFHVALKDEAKTTLQFCHDAGVVRLLDENVFQVIDEIEIELCSGDLANALKFVDYLSKKMNGKLIPQSQGKGARGFKLYEKEN